MDTTIKIEKHDPQDLTSGAPEDNQFLHHYRGYETFHLSHLFLLPTKYWITKSNIFSSSLYNGDIIVIGFRMLIILRKSSKLETIMMLSVVNKLTLSRNIIKGGNPGMCLSERERSQHQV